MDRDPRLERVISALQKFTKPKEADENSVLPTDRQKRRELSSLIEFEFFDDYTSVPLYLGKATTVKEIAEIIKSRELGGGIKHKVSSK